MGRAKQVFFAMCCVVGAAAFLNLGMPPVLVGIDLGNLLNYENQPVPSYITRDNMPDSNPITDEGSTLGRVLFYDPMLSINNEVSCSHCHQQEHAFSDLAELSSGVGGNTERHSMRLVNIRFGEDSLFRWDRSAGTLEEQMLIPIHHADEMGYSGTGGQANMDDLIAEMQATDYYPALFEFAFGSSIITEELMAKALAQFVRSIQSFDSKYDEGRVLVDSDLDNFPNFTPAENAGKLLFLTDFEFETDTIEEQTVGGGIESFVVSKRISGGFNCGACHRAPEFDIDPNSLNNGFIRNAEIEPGEPIFDFNVTRSPTMRDLIKPDGQNLNGGMFHIGEAMQLFGIMAHYEFRQIEPTNDNLDSRYVPDGLPQFLNATQQESNQLNAFLRTLSGEAVYTDERWSNPFNEDGSLTLLGANSVEMNAPEPALLYPTILTAGQPVFVQCSTPVDFTLTNLSGQTVMSQIITDNGALELPQLTPGVYVYRLGTQTAKLVIKPE